MNDAYFAIRKAARRGELDQLDRGLLTAENLIRPDPGAEPSVWREPDGPIQSAAAHGQLGFLPPEARTVRALLDCGHQERGNSKVDGAWDDAFYSATIENKLGALPKDAQFKADLVTHRDEVESSIDRAIRTLKQIERPDRPALGLLRAKQGIPLGAATTNAHTWIADVLSNTALPVADLPDVPSIPANIQARTSGGVRQDMAGR